VATAIPTHPTTEVSRPTCNGTNRRGEPCKNRNVNQNGYCPSHDPQLDEASRFGSPQQAREAATGVERRYPRLREIVERRLEEEADRIMGAGLDALDATRAVVVAETEVDEGGREHRVERIELVADHLTRLRAHEALLSRALGKPHQQVNVDQQTRQLMLVLDGTDPRTREAVHGFLRQRPSIAAG
jgi:hypothetical protein